MNQDPRETSPGRRLLLIAVFIVLWILGTLSVICWTGWLSLPHPERHARTQTANVQVSMLSAPGAQGVQPTHKGGQEALARHFHH